MPPEQPWLSVVMPVHEGGRWLEETLASVSREDTNGIELIIGDSSAGLECAAIVDRYSTRLRIDYRHCPEIKSWTRKTNQAAIRARASHIAMLHQDDLWLSGRRSAIQAAIREHPNAVMLLSPAHIIDENSRCLGVWRCPLEAGAVSSEQLLERLVVQNFIPLPAAVFRRDAWLAAGGLDENLWYTPDWDLYLKLARRGGAAYGREATTAFRIHSTSLTVTGSRNREDFSAQMVNVIGRHIDAIPGSRRRATLKRAMASAKINVSLAAAAEGERRALIQALASFLSLSPAEGLRYLRDSRIIERVWPRLRARMAGNL